MKPASAAEIFLSFQITAPVSDIYEYVLYNVLNYILHGVCKYAQTSWEANSSSAGQEIRCILWNPFFIAAFISSRQMSLS